MLKDIDININSIEYINKVFDLLIYHEEKKDM
jgi:hypothetical protein